MPVHVSLHDVTPAHAEAIDAALDVCARRGVRPALLVVPNHHGRWPLEDHPAFAARLRNLQAAGHEVYLHGFFHASGPRPAAAGLAWTFRQRVVSAGEAEFAALTEAEAARRLDAGLATLRAAGLRVDGFVPPAWSMPRWLLPQLAARGLRFTEDHLRIHDAVAGRTRASLVLNFASRSPARLLSTVAFCRAARPARALFPTRIAIHPGDMAFTLLRGEIDALLAWAAGDVVPTGIDLIAA